MKNIFDIIQNLGIKSRPILQCLLLNNLLSNEESRLVKGYFAFWDGRFQESLSIFQETEFIDERCTMFANTLIFESYINTNDYDNIELYYKILKSSLIKISHKLRDKINLELIWYEFIIKNDFSRIDSIKIDTKNDVVRSYYYFYKGRAEIAVNKNYKQGQLYFNLSYDAVKEKKRPTNILLVLNSFAYNENRYGSKKKAKSYAENLSYNMGFWLDINEFKIKLFCLDTIVEVFPSGRILEIFISVYNYVQDQDFQKVADKITNYQNTEYEKIITDYNKTIEYYKDQDISVPLDIYMSHMRDYVYEGFLNGELKARACLPSFTCGVERARQDLVKKFLSKFNHKSLIVFENLYFEQSEPVRKLIDCFCINYIRYHEYQNIFNDYNFKGVDLGFKKFNKIITEVVLYIFEPEEKEEIMKFFEKFISKI